MVEAAEAVTSARPDVVVVLSPHTPRRHGAWGIVSGPTVEGTFARFGAPTIGVALPMAQAAAARVEAQATTAGLTVHPVPARPLDHGALVPLQFVNDAGYRGPTVVIAFPAEPTHDECVKMGEALAR